ncbi:MAG: sialate O-acetylesterase, partial [Bacteroidota bacterium]
MEPPSGLALFVLMGQSNMTGMAPMPSRMTPAPENVYTYGNDGRWYRSKHPVDDPYDQIDAVSMDTKPGLGLGISFARELTDRYAGIGLVPCAKGGSGIIEWQPDASRESLYGSCLARVREAMRAGNPAGLLFFQGEADARPDSIYTFLTPITKGYARAFSTTVDAFRTDLGLPNLRVVFAQIGDQPPIPGYDNWAMIQAEQARVSLSNAVMIETAGLPTYDGI